MKYFRMLTIVFFSISMITCSVTAQTINTSLPVVLSTSSAVQCTIEDPHNVVDQQHKQLLEQSFTTLFTQMWNKYGYTATPPTISFIVNSSLISSYSTAYASGNKIVMNEFLFSGEDSKQSMIDIMLHECAHVTQQYKDIKGEDWIVEGIADYIVAEFSDNKRSKITGNYSDGELYDGYDVAANFLTWLEQNYSGSIFKIHRALQNNPFDENIFIDLTTKTLSDLWKEYSGKQLPSMEQYLIDKAQLGSLSHCKKLAEYYRYGYGGEPNYQKALSLYQQTANSDEKIEAMNSIRQIADIYFYGNETTKPDMQKAYYYYSIFIQSEYHNSLDDDYTFARLGDVCYEMNDIQNAVTWYEKAAQHDDLYSQMKLGSIYFNGDFGKKDTTKAQQYFLNIVQNADAPKDFISYSMTRLGDICYEVYDPTAIEWFTKAAESGDLYSQMKLGSIYFNGDFEKKDNAKAQQYFLNIIQNADAPKDFISYSMTKLGDICYEVYDPTAIEWFTKATEHGNMYSQNMLGYIYAHGIFGQKDIEKAKMYFSNIMQNTSASQSDKDYASTMLEALNKQ